MDLCIGLELWIKILNQHMSKDAVVLKNTIDLYTFMQFTQCIKRISLYNEANGRRIEWMDFANFIESYT